VRMDK